jgi:hypothetical protein
MWGRSLAELLFDGRCGCGWCEVGFALVMFDHGYSPCFQVDGCALCGLEEGVVILLCSVYMRRRKSSKETYVELLGSWSLCWVLHQTLGNHILQN